MIISLIIFWLILPVLLLLQQHQDNNAGLQCANGGQWVADGCTMDAQCQPYKPKPIDHVTCLNSKCCTMPCSNNGTFISKTCETSYDCLPSTEKVACLGGFCCTVRAHSFACLIN